MCHQPHQPRRLAIQRRSHLYSALPLRRYGNRAPTESKENFSMRRALCLVGLMILTAITAGSLSAQDNPFVGTWKLNVAKSNFGSGQLQRASLARSWRKAMGRNTPWNESMPMEPPLSTVLRLTMTAETIPSPVRECLVPLTASPASVSTPTELSPF